MSLKDSPGTCTVNVIGFVICLNTHKHYIYIYVYIWCAVWNLVAIKTTFVDVVSYLIWHQDHWLYRYDDPYTSTHTKLIESLFILCLDTSNKSGEVCIINVVESVDPDKI